jgi:predicted amidophosphoribosyltransferase
MEEAERSARPVLIDRLGHLLWEALRRTEAGRQADLMVPIPPDAGRFATRLYHPPDAIAKSLAKYSAIPVDTSALIKTRATQSLRTLDGDWQRDQEIVGSMEITGPKATSIRDKQVLLIDDVVTAGTHFREARRALRAAGAGRVYAAALSTARGSPVSV